MSVDQETISLTPEDLPANKQEQLSADQKQRLHQRRLLFLAGTFGFAGVAVTLLVGLAFRLLNPAFASRGELFLALPLGLFWLWLLRKCPQQLLNANRDLREGQIARLEGRVLCRWENNWGLVQFPKYQLTISGETFSLGQSEFFQFINRREYQIIYSPHSKVFLGAIPITTSADSTSPTNPLQSSPDSLLEPLTSQELKILNLAANGLSNKEIAQELSLSVNTVKMYSSQIYRKLGVSRRTEAIALARKLGML